MQESKIIEKCAQNQKAMEAFLEKLVNIDSKLNDPEGVARVAHLIGEKMQRIGLEVEYLNGGELPTHIRAVKKSQNANAKNVLIIGHMDTVFDKGTAAQRPFRIEGEKAYGPGVADMKSGITIALNALQVLYEEGWNEHNITVLLAGDEEAGHPETDFKERLIQTAENMDVCFNFETGVDNGDLVVSRRGVMYPVFKVEGKSAHAGKDPEKGASAIKELAYKILKCYELDDKERGINFNAGIIRGGLVANGIAGHAEVEADFRFDKVEDAPYIVEKLQEIADEVYVPGTKTSLSIDDKRTFLPMVECPGADALFKLMQEQAAKLGRTIQPITVGSGTDSCWTTYKGVPTICALGGRGGMNHSEKEYLFIESLTDRSQLFALTLLHL